MFDVVAIRPAQAPKPVRERERVADATSPAPDASAAPQDRVTISSEARTRAADERRGADEKDGKVSADAARKDGKLTPEQQRRVAWLQQRDAHVHQHEAAHQAAGGSLTGGASFSYAVGPDGRSYAVGGEVPVRLASGRTPDETIENARQARRAALAPSDPSPADLAVAAAATELEQQGQLRKARLATEAYGQQTRRAGAGDRPDAASDADAGPEAASGAGYHGSLHSADAEPFGATLVAA